LRLGRLHSRPPTLRRAPACEPHGPAPVVMITARAEFGTGPPGGSAHAGLRTLTSNPYLPYASRLQSHQEIIPRCRPPPMLNCRLADLAPAPARMSRQPRCP
jgi:hypothetical protein